MSLTKSYMRFSYSLVGRRLDSVIDSFEEWRRALRQADLPITLRMYLSTTIVSTILAFLFGVGFIVLLNLALPIVPLILAPFIGIIFSALTYVTFWWYPSYLAGERKRKLNASLPTVASYMTAMASAGVNPDKIFLSMSKEDLGMKEVVKESLKITRDTTIFGYDIIRAILEAAKRSPSPQFASFLEGIVAVFTSGGDLQKYLELSTKDLMIQKVQNEKDFIESLGLVAELFLVIGVVTPIFGIVMIAMLAFMQSSGIDSYMMLSLLVYIVVPVGELVILLMLDGMQPEE